MAASPDVIPVDPAPSSATAPPPDADLRLVPRRRPGRLVAAALALLVFAMVLNSVVRNPAFQWRLRARMQALTSSHAAPVFGGGDGGERP